MSRFQYYDSQTQKKRFKVRPMMIIGSEKDSFQTDFTAFPISSVSNKANLNPDFDINIGCNFCPNLKHITYSDCYVRVHKPTTINSNDILREKENDDICKIYPDKYKEINDAWINFNKTLF
ncbi:hypothetical protein QI049_11335 [Staphylococcus saprophyticus]|nr:hypothetical protein [Staphylococcus saprophyticus]